MCATIYINFSALYTWFYWQYLWWRAWQSPFPPLFMSRRWQRDATKMSKWGGPLLGSWSSRTCESHYLNHTTCLCQSQYLNHTTCLCQSHYLNHTTCLCQSQYFNHTKGLCQPQYLNHTTCLCQSQYPILTTCLGQSQYLNLKAMFMSVISQPHV